MSTEPTCEFCGASDKFRCKTQEQADECNSSEPVTVTRILAPQSRCITTPLPYFKAETLTVDGPNGKLSVSTMPDRSISVKREDDGVVVLKLHPDEAETMIAMLGDILNK